MNPHRLPRTVNPYMRYAMALHTLRTEQDKLDETVVRAMKKLERLPKEHPQYTRWLTVSETAMNRLALLQHNAAAEEREIALREGRTI